MNPDYASIATAAKEKARDILRTQMAVRIQERVQKAKDSVVSAIRHYASLVVDFSKTNKKDAEEAEKRSERRTEFDGALNDVPGISVEDRRAAANALDEERAENDKSRAENAKSAAKTHKEGLENALKRIAEAKESLDHANENLDKLSSGELKVDAEELKTLANKLIEEERAD